MKDSLRILAVAAPQWPRRPMGVRPRSLQAADPFSLQNALRGAAGQAEQSGGPWSDSNWQTIRGRNESVLLHEFCEDQIGDFQKRLAALQPHIVFIGSMSLSFPGAIRYASLAKSMATNPDNVLVVLGGKHCNETFWEEAAGIKALDCSPPKLMERGPANEGIDGIFDICVSGEAEELVIVLGEMVAEALRAGKSPASIRQLLDGLPGRAGGEWVVAALDNADKCSFVKSKRLLDFDIIPTAPAVFGVQSRFSVFDTNLTGHAYSDMGRGCAFNCFFCSERRDINGPLRRAEQAPSRLLQHFKDIRLAARRQGSGEKVSAFVEDSILLGASEERMKEFVDLLKNNPEWQMPFGIQLTVDFIRREGARTVIEQLKDVGLSYVAIGVETLSEHLADQMDKHHRPGPVWTAKTMDAVHILARELKLDVGAYVMWGWGENQELRERMLTTIADWQKSDAQPCVVSLNWLTRHPLHGTNHLMPKPSRSDFTTWGTPTDSAYLPLFVEIFGEASENYCLPSGDLHAAGTGSNPLIPSIEDLETLAEQFRGLKLRQ